MRTPPPRRAPPSRPSSRANGYPGWRTRLLPKGGIIRPDGSAMLLSHPDRAFRPLVADPHDLNIRAARQNLQMPVTHAAAAHQPHSKQLIHDSPFALSNILAQPKMESNPS